jgi:hypothetical protein
MTDPNQAPVMEMEGPGVFERLETAFRNSRLGQLATIGVASLGMASAAEGYMAQPVGAENVPGATSTPDASTTPSRQECIQKGLAKPALEKPPVMNHAGIRPFTPHHYYIQNISGELGYPDVSAYCPPELGLARVSHGQIEMEAPNGHETWAPLGPPNNPVHIGNASGESELNYSPSHAWPDSVFNGCFDGKFRKVRVVLTESLKDTQHHKVVKDREYTMSVPVHGSCVAAEESARATKNIRQNWGGA